MVGSGAVGSEKSGRQAGDEFMTGVAGDQADQPVPLPA